MNLLTRDHSRRECRRTCRRDFIQRENLLITRPACSQTKTPCRGCCSTKISVSQRLFGPYLRFREVEVEVEIEQHEMPPIDRQRGTRVLEEKTHPSTIIGGRFVSTNLGQDPKTTSCNTEGCIPLEIGTERCWCDGPTLARKGMQGSRQNDLEARGSIDGPRLDTPRGPVVNSPLTAKLSKDRDTRTLATAIW